MSNLKLNIKELNESIEGYKNNKENILEDINGVYESLKNVDAGWNDANTVPFINVLKNDKYNIENYFKDMDILYLKIEEFKNQIDNLCVKEGYKKNTSKLKINEEKINLIINKLNKVITYLNNARYYISLCNFKSNFSQIYKVNQLINCIYNSKITSNDVIDDIAQFNRNVNKIIDNYKLEISKISKFDIDIKVLDYKWKIQEIESNNIKYDNNMFNN